MRRTGFFAPFEPGFRWCLAVSDPLPRGCRFGFVRARLRHVFCLRAGACFFSFRGFRVVTSPPCGGRFFAPFEPGFRWCLAVRLRHVFCLRAGACFFSFRGFRVVTSPPCGGRFFAPFEPGFRWCLAVSDPLPRGCRFGFVRARLRHVFCLRTGACFFSFRGSRGATSQPCEGPFFASSELGFRWCFRAAFRSRRGWPNIVVSWLHSRLVVGTFFLQGLPLEPSSSKVAPRKFWERKIWRSMGATRRFDRNAGGPKLWQVGCIRGLPSGLAFANLGRENFAYRSFSEA